MLHERQLLLLQGVQSAPWVCCGNQGSWRGTVEEVIDRHKTRQRCSLHTFSSLLAPSGENASAKSAPKCLFLNKVGCISLVCAVHGSRAGVCSQGPNSVSLKMQICV